MNQIQLTSAALRQNCQDCGGYLSIAPIVTIGNRPLCGRCVRKHPNAPGCRNIAYEDLAKFCIFPCRYDSLGCQEKFPFNAAFDHEIDCDYQQLWCPAINCDEKICMKNMLLHFFKSHQHLIMTDAKIETVGLVEAINKIYHFDNNIFILRIRFNGEYIFINISHLKQSKFLCIIETIDANKNTNFHKCQITKYNEKFDLEDKTMESDLFCIIPVENQCICSFSILKSFGKFCIPDNNILAELFCPICLQYSKPIFPTCSNGHLVCSECFTKIKEKTCPQCFVPMKIIKGDLGNKLAEKLYYPCTYADEGCSAFSLPSEITLHESVCPYSSNHNISCFFNKEMSCNWQGALSCLLQHMHLKHLDRFLIAGRSIRTNLSILRHRTFFMKYNDDWFELDLHYEREKTKGFSIRLWLKTKSLNTTGYQYFLEFDRSPKERTRLFDICKKKPDYNLVISSQNIKAYLNRGELLFTIHIVKKIN